MRGDPAANAGVKRFSAGTTSEALVDDAAVVLSPSHVLLEGQRLVLRASRAGDAPAALVRVLVALPNAVAEFGGDPDSPDHGIVGGRDASFRFEQVWLKEQVVLVGHEKVDVHTNDVSDRLSATKVKVTQAEAHQPLV